MAGKKTPKKPQPLPVRYVSSIVIGSNIVESILHNGYPLFLIFNGEKFELKESIKYQGEELLPLKRGMYPYRPYNFDTEAMKDLMENFGALKMEDAYQAILSELRAFLDMDDGHRKLMGATVLESYVQHKIEETGYPYFFGDNDSGKTRALNILGLLCYRALETVDMTIANIYGYIGLDEGSCTILEDEVETLSKKTDREKLAMFRAGYRKGSVVVRTIDGSSKDRSQRFYSPFCVKAFTGLYVPNDKGFRQRLISIPCVWGIPEKDKITEEDKKRMDKIRLGLLALRMRDHTVPLPETKVKFQGRMREVIESKLRVMVGLSGEEDLNALALQIKNEKRESQRQTLEAFLAKAVIALHQRHKGAEIPFKSIWIYLHIALDEDFQVRSRSFQSVVLGRKITKTFVGLRLTSVFNGKPALRRGIGRVWIFEAERLEKLMIKYGLTDEDFVGLDVNSVNTVNAVKGSKGIFAT